jgi:hypothetical protein
LDLRFNDAESHMEIAPLETDHAVRLPSDRAKTLPTPLPLRTASPKKPRGTRAK